MAILGDSTNISSCWCYEEKVEEKTSTKPEPAPVLKPEKDKENNENNKDGSYVTLEGSNTLANNIAELAVQVAPVANPTEGFKEDAWLHYGADRSKVNTKMHDYIKIVDATITDYLKDTSNPNYHIGYNNPAYCSSAGSVGAIIRASVDPDFETFNNCAQITYISNNPKKWIKVGVIKAGDSFDEYCKPGDILIAKETDASGQCIDGHTIIYIGQELAKKRFPNTKGNIFQATYNSNNEGKESVCPAIDYVVSDFKEYDVYRPNEQDTSYYKKIDVDKVLSGKMKTGSFW